MDFDYVIVGGGSAGCALAARLSEDPGVRVALVEAGDDNARVLNRVPTGAAVHIVNRNRCNWAFESVPQAGFNGRRSYQPRGRGLGGSSVINAMIYLRGQPQDYDAWAAAGATGWGWNDVLPWFKRGENNERGADAWHGSGGPLNVMDLRSPNPFGPVFIEAAQQAGFSFNPDFNGATQEGVGPYQVTQKAGERWSAARAYLEAAGRRHNLAVFTHTLARRIVFEGQRAVGIEADRSGEPLMLRASCEVILAAGALQSPQLLMASGVGPAAHLAEHGIAVVADLPVGENLQDHLDIIINRRANSNELLGLSLPSGLKLARGVAQWRHSRDGVLTSNFAEAGGFVKTRPELDRPDLQLHFVIGMVDNHNRTWHWGNGMSCHTCALRPYSRGTVRLASSDTRDAPAIDPRFLSDERDLEVLLAGFKLTRRIFSQPAFAGVSGADRSREIYFSQLETDDEIRAAIRAHADTIYHPVGTCRMGSGNAAVVDPQLRVRGVAGLRVADCSIMPTLISGNTNAPAMMIGERAADFIRSARALGRRAT
ncbi:MAG: GMC family oxidoreductase N-terminal domain-containing protein [Burkholderiaceae bacterium]